MADQIYLPDTGLPLFHENLPQTLRRRIEGKQAHLPRERERARPSHAAVMAVVPVEEADEARWAKMPPRLRTRDQKRVLHNRTAVEKGLHVFLPFKSMDERTVKCLRCERDIDLWTWSGQKKIFNLTARLELKCGGDEFQGEEHSAVRRNGAVNPAIRQLQNQNNKKREARSSASAANAAVLCCHMQSLRPKRSAVVSKQSHKSEGCSRSFATTFLSVIVD